MENATALDQRPQLDRAFLDAVGEEIERSLRKATELEAELEHSPAESHFVWKEALDQMSLSLATWESRLGDLSRHTSGVESQLQAQESALRDWFQSLGITSSQLAALSV